MAKIFCLDNLYINFDPIKEDNIIQVGNYLICFKNYSSMNQKQMKNHTKTGFVELNGRQDNSIIYKGGLIGDKYTPRKRKIIEDVLLVFSILTGWNVGLTSKRYANFMQPHNALQALKLFSKSEYVDKLKCALRKIKDEKWQQQYENGFHLRMLLNQSNIMHVEGRFLLNVVIWEWLYPHLRNPNGATIEDEEQSLQEIFDYILEYFWPNQYIAQEGKSIFLILRNQLAHSGKLPINRDKAEEWMKLLEYEDIRSGCDIKSYIEFFGKLTQIIVLKTLEIDSEHLLLPPLQRYLQTGRIC